MLRTAVLATLVLAFFADAVQAANGWWTFNRNTNLSSTLSWKWTFPPSPTQYARSWRAGSGVTTDECEVSRGWLPSGWYAQKGHWDHYDGSKVRGRVWWLQDKTCRDGVTRRTELFIHSEETSSNGQSCSSAYDDPFCWEREGDYYSNGCIKLSHSGYGFPDNIQDAHWWWHNRDGLSFHGAGTVNDAVYVHS
jgi:hypothetical protein